MRNSGLRLAAVILFFTLEWLARTTPAVAQPGVVDESEPNDSIAAAQNLESEGWVLLFNPNIGDTTTNTSTTIPHLTIVGTGNDSFDYYSFSVANAGDRGIFDIDAGTTGGPSDAYLRLYDSGGGLLASNDDASPSNGQGGSTSVLDSYLEHVFGAPGIYVIEVGSCCINPVPQGDSYQLQVSVESHPTIVLETNLAITKDDGQTSAVPGETVTYEIIVTNSGPNDLLGASVTDVFPAELTAVTWDCVAAGGASCGTSATIDVEPNDTIGTAQDLDPENWSLEHDPNVGDTTTNTSTTIPHLTIVGTGDDSFDYYSFTVASAGDRGIFDIDVGTTGGPSDSYLRLYDGSGALLASNDDSSPTNGQGGSTSGLDSYLEHVFGAPGIYFIEVGSCCVGPVPQVESYQLQVSIEGHLIGNGMPGDIDQMVDLPVGGVVTFVAIATVDLGATGTLTNTASVALPLGWSDPDLSDNNASDVDALEVAGVPREIPTLSETGLVSLLILLAFAASILIRRRAS